MKSRKITKFFALLLSLLLLLLLCACGDGNAPQNKEQTDLYTPPPSSMNLPYVSWVILPAKERFHTDLLSADRLLLTYRDRCDLTDLSGKVLFSSPRLITSLGSENSQKRLIVTDGTNYGLVDLDGNWILPYQSKKITYWGQNLLMGISENPQENYYNKIDGDGKVLGYHGLVDPYEHSVSLPTRVVYDVTTQKLYQVTEFADSYTYQEIAEIPNFSSSVSQLPDPTVMVVEDLTETAPKAANYKTLGYGVFEEGKMQTIFFRGPLQLLSATPAPEDRLYFCCTPDRTYILVNRKGVRVYSNEFSEVDDIGPAGACVKENGKWGVLSPDNPDPPEDLPEIAKMPTLE